ncbi:hypothetical protein OKJ48_11480 [Streptomyces kunmingensis]|uniref:FHA domain-containing protein n=1 Tax=Streptomyces kunmingensis TaxID=68225 RepID=A0ABU6CAI0_9ACTN|nr:hypothetical protein [Streptomyces kunmingensis]MEB3960860.1 hypothetical protein [Streptomyces kunmingensis]
MLLDRRVPQGWAVRIDGSSTNTAHISNKATAPQDPTSPTLTVVGHPRAGRIKIKQTKGRSVSWPDA